MATSFGSSYGNTTFKYFQDLRHKGLEKSYALLSGGRFPTIFSPNTSLVLSDRSQNWDQWLHLPTYSRSSLDNGRTTELTNFYRVSCLPAPSLGRPMCGGRRGCLSRVSGAEETFHNPGISATLSCSLAALEAGEPSMEVPFSPMTLRGIKFT